MALVKVRWLRIASVGLAILTVGPALASHSEVHRTGWFEYVYSRDDGAVIHCNGLGVVPFFDASHKENLYFHERPAPGASIGTPILPTSVFGEGGGGIWVYMESNGIQGLQIGGTSPVPTVDGTVEMYDPFRDECPNSDTVLF